MSDIGVRQVAIRAGYATDTQCNVIAYSLVADDITIACPSAVPPFSVTATPVALAAGEGPGGEDAGYKLEATITGLSQFTEYDWTATQLASTTNGKLRTLPGVDDDFCTIAGTCDHCDSLEPIPDNEFSGSYQNIQDYLESPEALYCAAFTFVDDHGYVGKKIVTNTSGGSLLYRYIQSYLSNLALYADSNGVGIPDREARMGRDSARDFVFRNLNYIPQWGDWEFKNDFGWTSGNHPGADPTTWQAGYQAWDAMMGFLMPPLLRPSVNHTEHQAWMYTIGCCQFIAPDPITKADGTLSQANADPLLNTATVYGTTQIDDIKAGVDTSEFKVLLMGMGIRYPSATWTHIYNNIYGNQQPISDFAPNEYKPLFTEAGLTPPSLFDNPWTNGINGVMIAAQGDYHMTHVYRHAAPAYTGNVKEALYSVGAGGMNHLIGVIDSISDIQVGAGRAGTTVEYFNGPWIDQEQPLVEPGYGYKRFEFYGSEVTKRMVVKLFDSNNDILWVRELLQNGGNLGELAMADQSPQDLFALDPTYGDDPQGDEVFHMELPSGAAPPGQRRKAQTLSQMAFFSANESPKINLIPGNVKARTDVLFHDGIITTGNRNVDIPIGNNVAKAGLSIWRVNAIVEEVNGIDPGGFAIGINGGGLAPFQFVFNDSTIPTGTAREYSVLITLAADGTFYAVDSDGTIASIAGADLSASDLIIKLYIGSATELMRSYALTVETLNPIPRDTSLVLGEFPALKHVWVTTRLEDSARMNDPVGNADLTIINAAKAFLLSGGQYAQSSVTQAQAAADTLIEGTLTVPGTSDFVIIHAGIINNGLASNSFSIGSTIDDTWLPFTPISDTIFGVAFTNDGAGFPSSFLGAIGYLIQSNGDITRAVFEKGNDVGVTQVQTHVHPGAIPAPASQFSMSGNLTQHYSTQYYVFSNGVPSRTGRTFVDAVEFMADNIDLALVPFWHNQT